jgi:isopropylmalate/homocitrate/citramalate synthase
MDVRFIDTTFRDGSQSLWASGLRSGMIEAVAEWMDRAGFDVIEVLCKRVFQEVRPRSEEDPGNGAHGSQNAQHGQELHVQRRHSALRNSAARARSSCSIPAWLRPGP